MNDIQLLQKKICPDCGMDLYFYFESKDKPWCKKCDVYFTTLGEFVIRNVNALEQYNNNFAENKKQAEKELKGSTQ